MDSEPEIGDHKAEKFEPVETVPFHEQSEKDIQSSLSTLNRDEPVHKECVQNSLN